MALELSVLQFKFVNFENISSEPGICVKSKTEKDFCSFPWGFRQYPGGKGTSANNNEEGPVECETIRRQFGRNNGGPREMKVTLFVRGEDSNVFCIFSVQKDLYSYPISELFTKKLDILNSGILIDGALVIDLEIQLTSELMSGLPNIWPPNPFASNMLKLVENGDKADAEFKVNDTLVYADKLILKTNAPDLFNFLDKHDHESSVPINDTSLEVFHRVLRYVYGGGVLSADDMARLGMELIDANDQYGE